MRRAWSFACAVALVLYACLFVREGDDVET